MNSRKNVEKYNVGGNLMEIYFTKKRGIAIRMTSLDEINRVFIIEITPR